MTETDKTDIKVSKPWLFKSGDEWNGNAEGRPKGSVGFDQIWKQTVAKVAEEDGITPEEAEVNLMVAAYGQAKKGNSPYFKEIMDRKFGRVQPDQPPSVIIEQLIIVRDNGSQLEPMADESMG
jgi:hypothetical protein